MHKSCQTRHHFLVFFVFFLTSDVFDLGESSGLNNCDTIGITQLASKLNLQRKNKRDESSLQSRVPESTSQLIPNQGKTGVNGGPKWRQI